MTEPLVLNSPTRQVGAIWIGRLHQTRPAGRYLKRRPARPGDRERLERAEAAMFCGETCHGVQVSTYPRALKFCVILRTAHGKKLLSKHDTLEAAILAADLAEEKRK